MNIVPVPSRQFKTWSMWALIAIGVLNLAGVLVNALSDSHVFSPQAFAIANAVLAFLGGAAKLVQQQIAMTYEQKVDAINTIAEAPVKGDSDISVAIAPTIPKENL